MGLKIATVAAKVRRAVFQDAFFSVWSKLQIVKTNELATFEELTRWIDDELRSTETLLGFYQDGDWAALFDVGQCRIADEQELCLLSERVGPVIAALGHTTSSTYWFKLYEQGYLRRRICSDDGDLVTEGEPVAHGGSLDLPRFWLTDVEHLLESFGLQPYVAECKG